VLRNNWYSFWGADHRLRRITLALRVTAPQRAAPPTPKSPKSKISFAVFPSNPTTLKIALRDRARRSAAFRLNRVIANRFLSDNASFFNVVEQRLYRTDRGSFSAPRLLISFPFLPPPHGR
jgi:hypothetical protein